MESDAVLMRAYSRSRDADAFQELVRRYAGYVHGVCLRITGNRQDAEDATQECFLSLARAAGQIRRSPAGWLHAVATRRAIDTLRRRGTRTRHEANAARLPVDREPTWAEVSPYVDRALAGLPETLRTALILHYVQGRNQKEVAAELGVHQSTVSRRMAKGIELLRRNLKMAGVVAPAAVLAPMLAAHASAAVPTAIIAALGKMAMAGMGGKTGAAALLSGATAKATAVVAVAAVVTGAVLVAQQAPEPPAPPPPATAAAPKPAAVESEGEFRVNEIIPLGLVLGTPGRPRTAELEWIRFDTSYGNAWGVTAQFAWSAAERSDWRVAVDLTDAQGRLLPHGLDRDLRLVCLPAPVGAPPRYTAEVAIPPRHFDRRRHAARFGVRFEAVESEQTQASDGRAPARRTLLNVVEEASGRPIPWAVAAVTEYRKDAPSQRWLHLAIADAKGMCDLPLREGPLRFDTVRVQTEGFAPTSPSWPQERIPGVPVLAHLEGKHTMGMPEARTVGGLVRDTEGQPVAGVAIHVIGSVQTTGGLSRIERVAVTDAAGRWRLTPCPAGLERAQLLTLKHPDYIRRPRSDIAVGPDLTRLLEGTHVQEVERGITVSGVVTDERGAPIPGCFVTMAPRSYGRWHFGYAHAFTGEDGQFRFGNGRDDWTARDGESERSLTAVTAWAPGYAPVMKEVTVAPEMGPVDLTLAPGKTIRCRVVDAHGRPVEGASPGVNPLPGYKRLSWRLPLTDEEGRFSIHDAPDHEVPVTVLKTGHMSLRDYMIGYSPEEQIITLEPELRVTGRVADAKTGAPITGYKLVTKLVDPDTGRTRDYDWWLHGTALFADGRYELTFDELPAGSFLFEVRAEDYVPVVSEPFGVDPRERTIDFQLEPWPWVKGTVMGPNGEPLADADVHIIPVAQIGFVTLIGGRLDGHPDHGRATSRGDGRFGLPSLAGENYLLVTHAAGGRLLTEDELPQNGYVDLLQWGRIEIVLGDDQQASEGRQLVRLFHPAPRPAGAGRLRYADYLEPEGGRLVVAKVLPGPASLSCEAMPGSKAGLPIEVRPGETTRVFVDGLTVTIGEGDGAVRHDLRAPALLEAARTGDRTRIDELLAAGIPTDVADGQGRSPLHLAAAGGHREAAEALLAAGAEVNAVDHKGRTPAGLAVMGGHGGVAELLRENFGIE